MRLIVINHELTMTLMRLIAIKYFKCLTALFINETKFTEVIIQPPIQPPSAHVSEAYGAS